MVVLLVKVVLVGVVVMLLFGKMLMKWLVFLF